MIIFKSHIMAYVPNESEQQLKDFLESKDANCCYLTLKTQGDNTVIDKKPINLCEVAILNNTYRFGGISEGFYDIMVLEHHWLEKKVRIAQNYQNGLS